MTTDFFSLSFSMLYFGCCVVFWVVFTWNINENNFVCRVCDSVVFFRPGRQTAFSCKLGKRTVIIIKVIWYAVACLLHRPRVPFAESTKPCFPTNRITPWRKKINNRVWLTTPRRTSSISTKIDVGCDSSWIFDVSLFVELQRWRLVP